MSPHVVFSNARAHADFFSAFTSSTVTLRLVDSHCLLTASQRALPSFLQEFAAHCAPAQRSHSQRSLYVFGLVPTEVDNTKAAFLGYRPQDSSAEFAGLFPAKAPDTQMDDWAQRFQGGPFVLMGPMEPKA